MASTGSVFSPRLLSTLTVVVLLAHWAILHTPVPNRHPMEPQHAFTTRSIEFVPSQSAAPQQAPQAEVTKALRSQSAPAQAGQPQLAATPSGESAPAEPAPRPMTEALASPSQAEPAAAQDQPQADNDQLTMAPRPLREYAALANADHLPESVLLKYQVEANKFPYSLSAELWWQQNGQDYQARLAFSALGQNRVQTSRGQIGAQGLEPLRFSDKYRSEVAAHFIRDKGKVTFSANTPDVPLLSGAQDRLSILIQLASLIGSAPNRYPPATTMMIQTIGPRDADMWLFTVGETETLSLPSGPLPTLKLVRNARREFDQKVELWLAPALNYLPARIRITESNGDFVDQKWLASEPLPPSGNL